MGNPSLKWAYQEIKEVQYEKVNSNPGLSSSN